MVVITYLKGGAVLSEVISSPNCFVNEPIVLDKPATDLITEGYYRGERKTFRLFDYRNQWVVLFFYASDFTFV